jgi:glycosyltransferase involved in cell wall biosynthesis
MISHEMVPIRLAAVAASPVFYQTPLYRRLAADPRIALTVIFASSSGVRPYDAGFGGRPVTWDEAMLGGYDHQFVKRADHNDISRGFFALRDWDVVKLLWRGRYDAVWVHGYSYMTLWFAILAARLRGTALLIREEQTLLHERPRLRELARRSVLRSLFSRAHGLYIGSNNRDFFRAYGMPSERLFPAPYCVDNEGLRQYADRLSPTRASIREQLGVAGPDPVILFVGKLVPKKDPLTLVDAFHMVSSRSRCRLLIVGDGPLEREMRERLRAAGHAGATFAGFLNRSEIPAAYLAADIFCLPSAFHETWGIVVNEAMNFSLPLVVSDKVGSARDLVQPGTNGYIVPSGDSASLAAALLELCADPERRRRYGEQSLRIVSAWDVGLAVEGIVAAASAASGNNIPAHPVHMNA